MSGRSSTARQRAARTRRIVAAAEQGDTAERIAAREGVSTRTVRRILAAEPAPAAVVPVVEPEPVDVLRIDPVGELGRAIGVHRRAIGTLCAIAETTGHEGIRLGAARAAASTAAAEVDLLTRAGVLPGKSDQWRGEILAGVGWQAIRVALRKVGAEEAFDREFDRLVPRGTAIEFAAAGPVAVPA